MNLNHLTIGFALTGSFCTFKEVLPELERLVSFGANVLPIISPAVDLYDTRFYKAKQLKEDLERITGNKIIRTIVEAEPIGPKNLLNALIVAPCTGNTLAKLSTGVNDTAVTMAIKSTLRNNKPIILSVSTNDGLSNSGKNIGYLLNRKNIYFVPFRQDDPYQKINSVVADNSLILETLEKALLSEQIQPVMQKPL